MPQGPLRTRYSPSWNTISSWAWQGRLQHGMPILQIVINQDRMEKEFDVCVLGSANADFFLHVPHIPRPGQTIQVNQYFQKNGGKGANQAVAAARLGAKTVFVGQVGDDGLRGLLEKEMSEAGVLLRWDVLKDVPTGQATIFVEDTGENSIAIVGGANMHYKQLKLSPQMQQAVKKAKVLLLQKQIPIEINLLAAQLAKKHGTISILDCGGRDDPIPDSLISACDVISPNQTELLRLIDLKGQQPTAVNLAPLFAKHKGLKLLLKQGVRGCTLFDSEQKAVYSPSVKARFPELKEPKVIDTVGAGDCFTAAYGVGLCQGLTESQNMQKANEAAFLCVTKCGAMPSMPTKAALDAFRASL